jgi:hypothetical protein
LTVVHGEGRFGHRSSRFWVPAQPLKTSPVAAASPHPMHRHETLVPIKFFASLRLVGPLPL